jgi:putative DNA primase/helicase
METHVRIVDDSLVNRAPKSNGGAHENDEVTFLALAKLSPVEYDRARKKEAKRLGIGVTTLDDEVKSRRPPKPTAPNDGHGQTPLLCDPEPWSEVVDGAAVLDELSQVFERHLTLPEGAATVLALWTVFSHAHDAFGVSPILGITSPEKGCGKTTLEMLLGALVRRPMPTANITTSSLFRAAEQFAPTLIADEADTWLHDNEEMRGIYNSGWLRSQACVVRSVPVGDDFEARVFRTWCPKIIAQIGNPPGTIADRSIEVRMRRQMPAEEKQLTKLRADRLFQFEPLRRKSFRLANDWTAALKDSDPEMPEGFSNRLADNWRPLFSIADLAGGSWGARAREAARLLSNKRDDTSLGIMLLVDLKKLFDDEQSDRLASELIVKRLGEMEDRPWPEYSHGKAISKRGLSKVLGRFGISPRTVRLDDGTAKGYLLADCGETFSCYLPGGGSGNVTP